MRIISQDGKIDLPYEQACLTLGYVYALDKDNIPEEHYCILTKIDGEKYRLAEYTDKNKADYIFKSIYMAYHEGASVVILGQESEIEIETEGEATNEGKP